MKEYIFTIKEILERDITIESDNYDDALDKVHEMYKSEDIVLDSSDFSEMTVELNVWATEGANLGKK
jgi:hypothetical protein